MSEFLLENCPFCGTDDLKIQKMATRNNDGKINSNEPYWFVGCRESDCFITGPSSFKNIEDAVNKWNNRPYNK